MNRLSKMCCVMLAALVLVPSMAFGQREVQDFNRDWRFTKGEQPEAARQLSFNDSAWQAVRLPHDWAISGPVQRQGARTPASCPGRVWAGTGSRSRRQRAAGQRVYFDFDGVMAMPKVYVNGQKAGDWDYGYMSFRVDATAYMRSGQRNVVAVHVDTRQHHSRWYPGAGIYRKVTMP